MMKRNIILTSSVLFLGFFLFSPARAEAGIIRTITNNNGVTKYSHQTFNYASGTWSMSGITPSPCPLPSNNSASYSANATISIGYSIDKPTSAYPEYVFHSDNIYRPDYPYAFPGMHTTTGTYSYPSFQVGPLPAGARTITIFAVYMIYTPYGASYCTYTEKIHHYVTSTNLHPVPVPAISKLERVSKTGTPQTFESTTGASITVGPSPVIQDNHYLRTSVKTTNLPSNYNSLGYTCYFQRYRPGTGWSAAQYAGCGPNGQTYLFDSAVRSELDYGYNQVLYASYNPEGLGSYVTKDAYRVENGFCGGSSGRTFSTPPAGDLCLNGTPSTVSTLPTSYTWSCSGAGGGSNTSCSANREVGGVCGSANGQPSYEPPTANLCSSGTASAVTTRPNSYDWTCTGINNGSTASCSAPKQAPSATFSVSPSGAVPYGGSVTLSWTSAGATSCSGSGGGWWFPWAGNKTLSGSQTFYDVGWNASYPYDQYDLQLTCSGLGGSTTKTGTVYVSRPPVPAPTISISTSPASIGTGETSTLVWSSTNSTSCSASGSWSGAKPASGNQELGPFSSSNAYSYTLTCSGSGGTTQRTAYLTVSSPPDVTFDSPVGPLSPGGTADVSWSVSGATSCVASGGWSGAKPTSGSATLGPITQDTTYVLTCDGAGGTTTESFILRVAAVCGNNICETAKSESAGTCAADCSPEFREF